MSKSPIKEFCKKADCPASETLLRYRRHQLGMKESALVERHLRGCDFCSAELQLLSRHRIEGSRDRLVEMPIQLRKLAEELFGKSSATLTNLTTGNRLSG